MENTPPPTETDVWIRVTLAIFGPLGLAGAVKMLLPTIKDWLKTAKARDKQRDEDLRDANKRLITLFETSIAGLERRLEQARNEHLSEIKELRDAHAQQVEAMKSQHRQDVGRMEARERECRQELTDVKLRLARLERVEYRGRGGPRPSGTEEDSSIL